MINTFLYLSYKIKMDGRLLRYFLAVVRENNITKAAETLHITQPTLSRQLIQLEEEVEAQLLIRGKRNITLTEAGVLFKKRAEEIIELMEKTQQELKEQNLLINGEISVGAGEMESTKIFPNLFKNFKKKFPNVYYNFYTGNTEQIKEKIEQGLLDFGLLLEPTNIENFDYIRLNVKEEWGIIMRTDDSFNTKSFITPKDLVNQSIMLTKRKEVKSLIENWLAKYLKDVSIFATYNMITNSAILVEEGLGYAFVLKGSIYFYDQNKIIYKPLHPEITTNAVLVWKKHQIFSQSSKKFLEYIKELYNTL